MLLYSVFKDPLPVHALRLTGKMCSRLLGFTANYPQELSNARGLKCFKKIPKRLFHRSQETQNSIWTMEMLQRHKTILVAATFCGYEKSWHNDQPCKKMHFFVGT